MADQSFTISVTIFNDLSTQKQWRLDGADAILVDDAFTPAGTTRYLRRIIARTDQGVVLQLRLQFASDTTEAAPGVGDDLVDAWEVQADAAFFSQGGTSVGVAGPDHPDNFTQDSTEAYTWVPNVAKQNDLNSFFFTTLDTSAAWTLRLNVADAGPTDHATDGGSIGVDIELPEPDVDHTPAGGTGTDHEISGGSIGVAVALAQPSLTHNRNHATDGSSIGVAVALPEPSVTHTGLTGTDHEISGGSIGVTVALPQPSLTHAGDIVSDAGPDLVAQAGERAQLDGTDSAASVGAVVRYSWTQVTGPLVSLVGGNTSRPYFVAAEYRQDTFLSFALKVFDQQGEAATDYVTVTVMATTPLRERSIGTELSALNHTDLLIDQYAASTRFRQFIEGITNIAQAEVVDVMLEVERGLNPDESEGILLDWLGTRLDFPRPFVTAADAEYFGFDGTETEGGKPWDQAPFWTPQSGIENVEPIGDNTYRLMLKARARRLRGGADRETCEAVLDILFGNGYLDETDLTAPVLRVTVTDSQAVLYNLVSNRHLEAIIPKPAGVPLTLAKL